jgi:hypothetical protein
MLQFVLPNLTVASTNDLEETHPDGTLVFPFKHRNWEEFIRHMDEGLRCNYYKRHEEFHFCFFLPSKGHAACTHIFDEIYSCMGILNL